MWLVVVVVAACNGNEHRRCGPTIDEAVDRLVAAGDTVGLPADSARDVHATMVGECEVDRWSAEVLDCIAKVRLTHELEACRQQLTHAQYVRLQARLSPPVTKPSEVWVGPMPRSTPPPAARPPTVHTPAPAPALPPPTVHTPAPPALPPPPPIAGNTPPRTRASCATQIDNPRDRTCIAQFCRANPDDMRCMLE